MATVMKYKVNDIVKATVTKSKPGQDVGLSLEERQNRIYVTTVGGLFQTNEVPVHVEDQLLQVNGMSVSNKDLFPNGLEDVSRFLKAEWNIWLMVKKGSNSEDCPDQNEPIIGDTSISYPSIHNRQVKYSSPYLHSHSVSYDSEDSANANSEDEATSSRRSCDPQRRRTRSSSPHWARKPRSQRKPRSMRKPKEDVEDYSENTETTCALSDDDQTPPTPRAEAPNLLSIEEDESSKSLTANYISNIYDVKDQPIDHDTTHSDDVSIKSIKGNSRGIHVEMNDGQSISVTPDQLLRVIHADESSVVTEASSIKKPKKQKSKGKLKDKRSKRDLKKKSKREQKKSSSKYLHDSDFEESEGEMPLGQSVKKSKKKVKRRNSAGYMRKDDDDDQSVETMSSKKSRKSKKKVKRRNSTGYLRKDDDDDQSVETMSSRKSKKSKRKVKRRNSTGYLRNPEADSVDSMSDAGSVRSSRSSRTRTPRRKSLSSLRDNESSRQNRQPQFRSSRNKRGSLMDSSTHSCMTNLIDPGDLMKIRGFTSKPEMNDLTVEVVRKSKGTKGKRWDVRMVAETNVVKARCSFDPKRLISVATENLKHFV